MIELLNAHSDAVIALASAVLGAGLGFFGSLSIWWIDRRRQRQIARMRIALNLRHWINSVLSQMHDVHNWESSDRHAGAAHFEIPDFLFETSLEQVASVDYRTAMEIFGVIHRKDDATDEISHFIEFGDDDEPIDTWRGRTSQVWLQAIQIYDHISRQIGWSEHAVSDQDRAMMQGEVDDFQKRTQDRAKAHAHPSEDLDV